MTTFLLYVACCIGGGTYVSPLESYRLSFGRAGASRLSVNRWSDRERGKGGHLFFADEGMDGAGPLVDVMKGGL